MQRHEIPTHLNVEDRLVFNLSLRQVLYLVAGLSGAYGLWTQWSALPVLARAALAAACLLAAAVVALVRPGGRPLDAWALAVLHYAAVPRRSVWRRSTPGALLPSIDAAERAGAWAQPPASVGRWAARRTAPGRAGTESLR